MANEYYTPSGKPLANASGLSADIRAEFDLIDAAFNKLPGLSGNANKLVVVNAGGTALSTTTGSLSLSAPFTTLGASPMTFTLSGATAVVAPTSGTLLTTTDTRVSSATGTWTPVLTCQTPGDLSVSYSAQNGRYARLGSIVALHCMIATSACTHTTATGQVLITGLPFSSTGSFPNSSYAPASLHGFNIPNTGDGVGVGPATGVCCHTENSSSAVSFTTSSWANTNTLMASWGLGIDRHTSGNGIVIQFCLVYIGVV